VPKPDASLAQNAHCNNATSGYDPNLSHLQVPESTKETGRKGASPREPFLLMSFKYKAGSSHIAGVESKPCASSTHPQPSVAAQLKEKLQDSERRSRRTKPNASCREEPLIEGQRHFRDATVPRRTTKWRCQLVRNQGRFTANGELGQKEEHAKEGFTSNTAAVRWTRNAHAKFNVLMTVARMLFCCFSMLVKARRVFGCIRGEHGSIPFDSRSERHTEFQFRALIGLHGPGLPGSSLHSEVDGAPPRGRGDRAGEGMMRSSPLHVKARDAALLPEPEYSDGGDRKQLCGETGERGDGGAMGSSLLCPGVYM